MFKKFWYSICTTCRPNQSKTVRFAFPLAVIAALFIGAAVITDQESYISIETNPTNVEQGSSFIITVRASAHTPINAIDIILEYPESQMEVIGIDTGESVITLWTEEPYAADGLIHMRGGTFQQGFIGEHIIARVRARASESGTAHVSADTVRFIAGDGLGTEISVSDQGQSETKIYIAGSDDGSLSGKASVSIVTDIDGDGDVDLRDISAFMGSWFKKDNKFDFNGDGRTTFKDFSILLSDAFRK